MEIINLHLTNFRNWSEKSIDWQLITVLVGKNGVGKTNILEAVYVLSTTRSWRGRTDHELIQWGKDLSRLQAIIKDERQQRLELVVAGREKIVKIQGVKKHLATFLGTLKTVLFCPENLEMVAGSPVLRRRFLNILLCQTKRSYTLHLTDLNKILRLRNQVLFFCQKVPSRIKELAIWDEKLVEAGTIIWAHRQKAIDFFNQTIGSVYQQVSGLKQNFRLKYYFSASPLKYREILLQNREREISQASTLFGPHRDDFRFILDGRDMAFSGSRAEFRSAVLALKIAEVRFLESQTKTTPVLLLDDIFSELDKDRREQLGQLVQGQQTIITTTDLDHLSSDLLKRAKVIQLD